MAANVNSSQRYSANRHDSTLDLIKALNDDSLTDSEFLLKNGADPNRVLPLEGVAPMHIAAGHGFSPVCLLLKYGGDPNVSSVDGSTPLHIAAIWGKRDVLQLLLQNGGDPYLQDQDGMTVLSSAQAYDQHECARLLEEYAVLLNPEEWTTPKYYFTRLDDVLEEHEQISTPKPQPRKSCMYNNMTVEDYLQCEKSNNFYTEEINRKLKNFALEKQRVTLDVTSPEHPYVALKSNHTSEDDTTIIQDDLDICQSLRLSGSLALSDSLRKTSSSPVESFVTCNSEPDDCSPSLLTGKCAQVKHMNGCRHCENMRRSTDTPINTAHSAKYYRNGTNVLNTETVKEIEDDEVTDYKDKSRWKDTCTHTNKTKEMGNRGGIDEGEEIVRELCDAEMHVSKQKHTWLPPTQILNDTDIMTSEGSISFMNNGRLSYLITSDESSGDTTLPASITASHTSQPLIPPTNSGDINEKLKLNLESLEKMTLEDKIINYLSPDKKMTLASDLPRDMAGSGRPTFSKRLSGESNATTIEYVYKDPEKGVVLIETHLPSEMGSVGRRSIESVQTAATVDSQETELYDWKAIKYESLENKEIRNKLKEFGEDPGPVTATTRQTYITRLKSIENDEYTVKLTTDLPDYPAELARVLDGNTLSDKEVNEMKELEERMIAAFANPSKTRRWREGTIKSSFNYILLDPRVTLNLPNRAHEIGDLEAFRTFIGAVFYIGKGKRARPYSHLYEALKQRANGLDKVSDKVQQILDIWSEGMGVVSLHIFQNVIPVEAYTREAAMVDAISLSRLTNKKRGDYYGVATTWSSKQRRRVGVYLLQKALRIFLAEGERQISPPDIKKGC